VTVDWFRALMDSSPEVYFRYAFAPTRRFAYVSRAIESLTGHAADAFYADAELCLSLVPRDDRQVFRQIARARRGTTCAVRLQRRDGTLVRVTLRTVPVIRNRKLVAVEGVASPIEGALAAAALAPHVASEPFQQRLAALLVEVHDILHGTLRPGDAAAQTARRGILTAEDIALDSERMTVTLAGEPVALTGRELLLLRYFLQRPSRIVTRKQLLTDVWGYRYGGDDRTVDVHLSRLRRKLPPLRRLLRSVKHIGYVLELAGGATPSRDARIANK
jgi:PAS domain S-box-containing protein